ncbi:MAG TPA: tRNA dihydrouridine(16) synthase DusC, partial [Plasticicumulans sp.]|nr:tRNA dihydrouridine(16) synthase DusC [Plasticicumulans sp.]
PGLALNIRSQRAGHEPLPLPWPRLLALLDTFYAGVRAQLLPRHAPGRLKQWLSYLRNAYPEAQALFARVRTETDAARLGEALAAAHAHPVPLPP